MLAGRALHQFLGHHRAADVVGDGERRAQHGVRQDDREFLAAVARGDVLALDVLLHRHGDEPQHLVAGEMAAGVVEILEMIDVGHHQRQRLARLGARRRSPASSVVVEILAVGERGERIGQALGADDFEIFLQLVDLLLGGVQALLQRRGCSASISLAVCTRLSTMARRPSRSLELPSLSRDVGQALGIGRGGADGGVDHRHDLVDLVHHARADVVDAFGEAGRREVGRRRSARDRRRSACRCAPASR